MTTMIAITVIETAYTLFGVFGFIMFGAAVGVMIPKVIVDSPADFFLSLLSPRRIVHLLKLIDSNIRDDWPDTKLVGISFYGGGLLLGLAAVLGFLHSFAS